MDNNTLAIYKKTQELASLLATQAGFDVRPDVFHSEHGSSRITYWFASACEIMAYLHNHEMADIVNEAEKAFELKTDKVDAITVTITDYLRNANLGKDGKLTESQAKALAMAFQRDNVYISVDEAED